MMHRWRRDILKLEFNDFSNSRNKEPVFMQSLSNAVKIFKKKEDFYLKVLLMDAFSERPLTSKSQISMKTNKYFKLSQLQKEHDQLQLEEDEIIQTLKHFEKQSFYNGKNYLYTVFLRFSEILEGAKLKIKTKIKLSQADVRDNWEQTYEQAKTALIDCYQNLIYFQKYHAIELINLAKRKQNNRIHFLVPPKNRKTQIILNPIKKNESSTFMKTNSLQLQKKKKLESFGSKKLIKKKQKKLETEKRLEEKLKAKELKEKKKDPVKYFYGILGIKALKVQDHMFFRRDMELQMIERNRMILDERKNWQKKYEFRESESKLKIRRN